MSNGCGIASRHSVRTMSNSIPAIYREPPRPHWVLPSAAQPHGSHRKALPLRHSYFELMRHTKILSRPRFGPCTKSLRRLLRIPAGSWRFPTLFCKSFSTCLDPYPGCSCGVAVGMAIARHPPRRSVHAHISAYGSCLGSDAEALLWVWMCYSR